MSIRYGIGLALEPVFTSRAYRARQLICGQYASWAAEMNMVYLDISGFFQCAAPELEPFRASLAAIATQSRDTNPQFILSHRGVAGSSGHIYLDFAATEGSSGFSGLYQPVARLLEGSPGLVREKPMGDNPVHLHLPLLQYADLPGDVFQDALEFAQAVALDLQIPADTQAWRLLLLWFESGAAGDDWTSGSWAADLRWQLLGSFAL